jgi:hypothetical protein
VVRTPLAAFVVFCATANNVFSDEVPNTSAINIEVESVEGLRVKDSRDANQFSLILRVNLLTNSDLAELSRKYSRDVHIAASGCNDMAGYLVHNMYSRDPAVYDALGKITSDRGKAAPQKTGSPNQYQLYFPIQQDHRAFVLQAGLFGYPVPNDSTDLCLQILGTKNNFFSNQVRVPRGAINAAIEAVKPQYVQRHTQLPTCSMLVNSAPCRCSRAFFFARRKKWTMLSGSAVPKRP